MSLLILAESMSWPDALVMIATLAMQVFFVLGLLYILSKRN
jgi:hypothetical protein